MPSQLRALGKFVVTVATLAIACGAYAADWNPDKRIELVVPNAAGGTVLDLLSEISAEIRRTGRR